MNELSLLKYYLAGGMLMHPIFLLMVVSTAWSLKQYLNLTYNYTLNENFFNKIKFLVKDGRVHEAYQHCLSTSHPVSKIFAAILYNSNRNKDIIESALKIETLKVLPHIKKGTRNIYQCVKMALLLGAIGIFHTMGGTESGVGLHAGVFSLFVALQCMVFYTYLSHREKNIYNRYQEIISEVAHLVIFKQYAEIVNEDSQGATYRRYGT